MVSSNKIKSTWEMKSDRTERKAGEWQARSTQARRKRINNQPNSIGGGSNQPNQSDVESNETDRADKSNEIDRGRRTMKPKASTERKAGERRARFKSSNNQPNSIGRNKASNQKASNQLQSIRNSKRKQSSNKMERFGGFHGCFVFGSFKHGRWQCFLYGA